MDRGEQAKGEVSWQPGSPSAPSPPKTQTVEWRETTGWRGAVRVRSDKRTFTRRVRLLVTAPACSRDPRARGHWHQPHGFHVQVGGGDGCALHSHVPARTGSVTQL